MATPWLNADGHVIVNDDRAPVLCDDCQCNEPPFLACNDFVNFLHGLGAALDITLFVPCGTTETISTGWVETVWESGQQILFERDTANSHWEIGFTCFAGNATVLIRRATLADVTRVFYGAGGAEGFTNGVSRVIPETSDPGANDCDTVELTLGW